jgi:hypothetical protein
VAAHSVSTFPLPLRSAPRACLALHDTAWYGIKLGKEGKDQSLQKATCSPFGALHVALVVLVGHVSETPGAKLRSVGAGAGVGLQAGQQFSRRGLVVSLGEKGALGSTVQGPASVFFYGMFSPKGLKGEGVLWGKGGRRSHSPGSRHAPNMHRDYSIVLTSLCARAEMKSASRRNGWVLTVSFHYRIVAFRYECCISRCRTMAAVLLTMSKRSESDVNPGSLLGDHIFSRFLQRGYTAISSGTCVLW